jgi:transposase
MGDVLDIQTVVSVLVNELSVLKQQNEKLIRENTELRERLSRYEHPKNSRNSSFPSSKDPIGMKGKINLRAKSDRKSGGQAGHPGHFLKMQTPDSVAILVSSYCSCCGRDLSDIAGEEVDRRQQIDIPPIRPHVTEYRRIRKICSCSHVNVVDYPSTVTAPVCYGSNLQALVAYFNICQHIPYKRMVRMLGEVFNVAFSQGSIRNILNRMQERLTPAYELIRKRLQQSQVVGVDETGTSVNGKTRWAWVWQNTRLTYITGGHSRKKEVFTTVMPEGMPESTLVSELLFLLF